MPNDQTSPPKRKSWFRFTLSSLILMVTVTCIVLGYPHMRRYYYFEQLKQYAGKDLRKLSEEERDDFDQVLSEFIPAADPFVLDSTETWFFWKLNGSGKTRFALFRPDPAPLIGSSGVEIRFYDPNGNLVDEVSFPTGWKIKIEDAALDFDEVPGETVICIKTNPFNTCMVSNQFYSINIDANGDSIVSLVRLENHNGKLIDCSYLSIGPRPPERSKQQWIDGLSDLSKSEVLCCHTWLRIENDTEAANALRAQVLQAPQTKPVLQKLSKSDHFWVAEAAAYALLKLENPDYQPKRESIFD